MTLPWEQALIFGANTAATSGGGGGGGGYDAATNSWIASVMGAGGNPSTTQKGYVDTLITTLKSGGVFTGLDRLWVFCLANEDIFQAKIDLIHQQPWTGTPTYTLDANGWQGNGSSGFLDTNFNPATAGGNFALNSCSLGGYLRTSRAATNNAMIGGVTAGNYSVIFPYGTGSILSGDLNATAFPSLAVSASQGQYVLSRNGSTTVECYYKGTTPANNSSASTSGALTNTNLVVGGYSSAGSPTTLSTDTYGAVWIGKGFSSGEITTITGAIYAILGSLGKNVY